MTEEYRNDTVRKPLSKRIMAALSAVLMSFSVMSDLPLRVSAEPEGSISVSEGSGADDSYADDELDIDENVNETESDYSADDLSLDGDGLPVFDDNMMTAASMTGGGEDEVRENYEILLGDVKQKGLRAPAQSSDVFAYDDYESMAANALEQFSLTYDTTIVDESTGDTASHIERDENFFVKTVISIHSQLTVNPGKMSFSIPKYLLTERNGYKCKVSSVGVSAFESIPTQDAEGVYNVSDSGMSDPTSFRYFEDGDNIVFVNFRELHSETIRIQVSYEPIEVFDVVDNTEWELDPYINITYDIPKTGFLNGKDNYTECTYTYTNDQGDTVEETVYEHTVLKIGVKNLTVYQDENFKPLFIVDTSASNEKTWYKVEDQDIAQVADQDFSDLDTSITSLWTIVGNDEHKLDAPVVINENVESLKVENQKGDGVTGKVNTSVEIGNVTKAPEVDNNGYGQQLYTLGQMKRYMDVSKVPDKYLKDNGNLDTDNYIFTTWRVTVTGECTQPWSLLFEEHPWIEKGDDNVFDAGTDVSGAVIGVSTWKGIPDTNKRNFNADVQYKDEDTTEIRQLKEFLTRGGAVENPIDSLTVSDGFNTDDLWYVADANKFDSDDPNQYNNIRIKYGLITGYKNVVKDRRFNSEFSVVVAYPKEEAKKGADDYYELCNQLTAHMIGRDDDSPKKSNVAVSNPIIYHEYEWTGGGYYFDSGKSSGKDKEGWLTIYDHKDTSVPYMGTFDFSEWMTFRGYQYTHQNSGGYEYIDGSYVRIVNADDVLTAQATAEIFRNGVPETVYGRPFTLNEDDYYFSSAEIGVLEMDIDPFADETQLPDPSVKISADVSRDWVVYGWYNGGWNQLDLRNYGLANSTITLDDYINAKKDSGGYANFTLNFENDTNKPIRLKVEKNTIGYQANIRIKPKAVIKTTSRKFSLKYRNDPDYVNDLRSEFYYADGTPVVSTLITGGDGTIKITIRNYSANTITKVDENGNRAALIDIAYDDTKYRNFEANVYDSSINGNRYDFVDQYNIYPGTNDRSHIEKDDMQQGKLSALGMAILDAANLDGNAEYVPNKYISPDTDIDHNLYGEEFSFDKNRRILRDSAAVNVTTLIPDAHATKYAAYENDTRRGRVIMTYTIMGYEGYMLDRSYEEDISNASIQTTPLRRIVYLRDLLPSGVNIYSEDPVAGKLKKALVKESGEITYPDVEKYVAEQWDTSKARVVEMTTDANWNGTGRTLVMFKVEYQDTPNESGNIEKGDIGFFANDRWFIGCGVQFKAYVSWDDYESAKLKDNIFAYVASSESKDDTTYKDDILGRYTGYAATSQTFDDAGTLVPNGRTTNVDFSYFEGKLDFDEDGNSDEKNRMYGHANSMEAITTAKTLGITKSVKSDSDVSAEYVSQTGVIENEHYTYKIHIDQSGHGNTGDLVIFDDIEAIKHNDEEGWQGTLVSVDVEEIKKNYADQKPAPVIYYSASSEAPTKLYTNGTAYSFTKVNDDYADAAWDFVKADQLLADAGESDKQWIKSTEWRSGLENVKSIAVDLSKKENGDPFIVSGSNVINLYIHMQAPGYGTAILNDTPYDKTDDKKPYAFNSSSFYYHDYQKTLQGGYERVSDQNKKGYSYSNATTVTLGQKRKLEVRKNVPQDHMTQEYLENAVFTFKVQNKLTYAGKESTVSEDGTYNLQVNTKEFDYANIEYELWQRSSFDSDDYTKVQGTKHYTNDDGEFNLTYLQKAVFTEVAADISEDNKKYDFDNFIIVEKSAPYVFGTKRVIEDNQPGEVETRVVTVTNHYRPVIYLTKNASGYPDSLVSKLNNQTFDFKLNILRNEYDTDGTLLTSTPINDLIGTEYRILNKTIDKNDVDNRKDGKWIYYRKIDSIGGLYDVPTGWTEYAEGGANLGNKFQQTEKFTINVTANQTVVIPIYIEHIVNSQDEGMLFVDRNGNYHQRYDFEIIEDVEDDYSTGKNTREWKLLTPADNLYKTDLENEQNSAVFTNVYKYRDLLLKKTVTHAPANVGEYAYAFRLTRDGEAYYKYANNKSVTWQLFTQDSSGKLTEYKYNDGENDWSISGTVGANGVFVVPFCGNDGKSSKDPIVIRISGAEMENTYTISEIISEADRLQYLTSDTYPYTLTRPRPGNAYQTITSNSSVQKTSIATDNDFRAVIGKDSATLTKKDLSADLAIENDYLKRDIKISKVVAASTMPENNKKFEMILVTESATAPETANVVVTKADGTVDTNPKTVSRVDNNSDFPDKKTYSFELCNNESIVFSDIDKVGEVYEFYEKIDGTYKPIDQPDATPNEWSAPQNIMLSQNEDSVLPVVNGEKGYIIIRKEYKGDTFDGILANDKVKLSITSPTPVKTPGNGDIQIKHSNGVLESLNSVNGMEITSSDILIINAQALFGDNYEKITVTETDWTKNFEKTETGDIYHYVVKPASMDSTGMNGEFVLDKDDAQLTVVNDVTKFESVIYKRIGGNLDSIKTVKTPADDSDITFIVKENGKPVQGVKCVPAYIDGEGNTVMSDAVCVSGSDGRIRVNLGMLKASSFDGWSEADGAGKYFLKLFFNRRVKINSTSAEVTITEDAGSTHSDWGNLVGYEKYGDSSTYVDSTTNNGSFWTADSDTFVNVATSDSNNIEQVAVTKTIHHETAADYTAEELDAEFSFTIYQKVGGELVPAPNVKFEVYELDDRNTSDITGKTYKTDKERSGTTGADGKFTLKHGQKAVIALPKNAEWQIVENNAGKYKLRVDDNDNITHGGDVDDGGDVTAATSYNGSAAAAPYNTKEITQGFELATTRDIQLKDPFGFDVVLVNGGAKGATKGDQPKGKNKQQVMFAAYDESQDSEDLADDNTTKMARTHRYKTGQTIATNYYYSSSNTMDKNSWNNRYAYKANPKTYLLGYEETTGSEYSYVDVITNKDGEEVWSKAAGTNESLYRIGKHYDIVLPDTVFFEENGMVTEHKLVGIGRIAMTTDQVNKITISKYIKKIGDSAFNANSGLSEIVWNCEDLKVIGAYAFNKTKITKAIIPDTVENLEEGAFSECALLSTIILPSGKLTLNTNSINTTSARSAIIFQTKDVNDLSMIGDPITSTINTNRKRYFVFTNLDKATVEAADWYSKISNNKANQIYYKDTLTAEAVNTIYSQVTAISAEAKTILDNAVAGSGSPATGMLAVYNVPFITKQQFLF